MSKSVYMAHITLDGIHILNNHYTIENFNPISISNSSKMTVAGLNLVCPINSLVEYEWIKDENFDCYCIPMDGNRYSTAHSTLTTMNGSFHKSNPRNFQCPEVVVCSAQGIQSKGDIWGYIDNALGGEINFLPCPAFHCCQSLTDCQSFDTCRNERIGDLCGKCHKEFSMSLFNEYACIPTEQCESYIIWLLILVSGVFIAAIFTYPEKAFKLFDFLERTRKKDNPQANKRTNNMSTKKTDIPNDENNSKRSHKSQENKDENGDANEDLLQSYPDELAYITNERPVESHSALEMAKILSFFYQAVGLLLINNSVTSKGLILTEIISSILSMKLQIPSLEYNACPMVTHNVFILEITKLSILFVPLGAIISLILCILIYKRIKPNQDMKNRNDYEVIDEKVDEFEKPSLSLRLKSAYVQIICFGYTSVTVLILHNIHLITIEDKCVMFLDASIKCSDREDIFIICIFLILFWCLMFPIGLFFGCKWLSCCKITLNCFLLIVTIPPIILILFIKIRRPDMRKKNLNQNQTKSAKYILEIINGPYRMKRNIPRGEPQTGIVWDCFYLLRGFVLSFACVLLSESTDRLVMIWFILLIFLVFHLHVKPFKMARMNQMEILSSVSLLLMSSCCFIMNSHVESTIIFFIMDMFVVLSFIPIIAYIAFILYDVIFIFVFNFIGYLIG